MCVVCKTINDAIMTLIHWKTWYYICCGVTRRQSNKLVRTFEIHSTVDLINIFTDIQCNVDFIGCFQHRYIYPFNM